MLARIGRAFRRAFLPASPCRCAVCGEPVTPGAAAWSAACHSWVDRDCVPAIVRRRGYLATGRYLATGEIDFGYPEPDYRKT